LFCKKFTQEICVQCFKNYMLRKAQIIAYDYPNYPWEKDNYRIREGYEDLVKELIDEK